MAKSIVNAVLIIFAMALASAALIIWGGPWFQDLGAVKAAMDAWGPWSIPLFLLIQVAQVFFFFLPGEIVQIAGGLLYGTLAGTAVSTLGIALGSLLAFGVARALGRNWVENWVQKKEFRSLEHLIHHPRLDSMLLILMIIPGLPKDILCYLAGLSTINWTHFLIISTLGRIPGLIISSLIGASALGGQTLLPVITMASLLALTVVAILFRKPLLAFLFGPPAQPPTSGSDH